MQLHKKLKLSCHDKNGSLQLLGQYLAAQVIYIIN